MSYIYICFWRHIVGYGYSSGIHTIIIYSHGIYADVEPVYTYMYRGIYTYTDVSIFSHTIRDVSLQFLFMYICIIIRILCTCVYVYIYNMHAYTYTHLRIFYICTYREEIDIWIDTDIGESNTYLSIYVHTDK